MAKKISKSLYWTPRILSILFITFLALMSLDVFSSESGFWQIMLGLFMHNIPVFILIGILLISWKHEIVGGITFILAGILYFILVLITAIKTGFEWYYLAWVIQISGIAFLIGILFLINWSRKKNFR
ncbi:MAG TPA: hypothetical protein HA283_00990 [Nanoarchaeota archaeon]|nr:hypothetical protein [Nanoarchaeota archaeon]HIH62848.1 hypothetical protein [Nanoarchaeota archaeon]HIJ09163.1 hypothetical protein [Nanoarchaeota archaeon]